MGFGFWRKIKNAFKKVGGGIKKAVVGIVKGAGKVFDFAKDKVLPVANQLAPVIANNPFGAKALAAANVAGGVYDQLRTQSRKIKLS